MNDLEIAFSHLAPDTTQYPTMEEIQARRDFGEPLNEVIPGLERFPTSSFQAAYSSVESYADDYLNNPLSSKLFLEKVDDILAEIRKARQEQSRDAYLQAIEALIAASVWAHHSASVERKCSR